MSMPTGDSNQEVRDYYLYLNAHHQSDGKIITWKVDWFSIAWLWGFVIVSVIVLIWWVWQYRSTVQPRGLYPAASWGGYTTEIARPATRFFLLLTAVITAFGVAIIVGHLVWGQKF